MKRSELKKVLKPLIKECIKEAVFEEGILSGLIAEVLRGTEAVSQQQKLTENEKPATNTNYKHESSNEDCKLKLRETKKKMLDAIGENAYNGIDLFEGTEPFKRAGAPAQPGSPLESYASSDAGVDISAIFSPNWKNLV